MTRRFTAERAIKTYRPHVRQVELACAFCSRRFEDYTLLVEHENDCSADPDAEPPQEEEE